MIKKVILCILLTITCTSNVLALPIITNNVPDIDSDKKTNLMISFTDEDDNPLDNASFSIYKIASVSGKGVFTTTSSFSEYNLSYDIQELEGWDILLEDLIEIINHNDIDKYYEGKTDSNGQAKFNNIEKGLYLVIGEKYIYGARTYTPQSFLISVPNMVEQDIWEYDVTVFPKYEYDIDMSKIMDKKVIKIWDDEKHINERPSSVTIDLLKDNVLYDEIILNEHNNWTYTWKELDDSFNWTVVEKNIDNKYSSKITYEDNLFKVTNTYIKDLPFTGLYWWPVPLLIGVGIILLVAGIFLDKKNKKKKEEIIIKESK